MRVGRTSLQYWCGYHARPRRIAKLTDLPLLLYFSVRHPPLLAVPPHALYVSIGHRVARA
eukprot:1901946-Rhodomonas_salina.1